ncbi:reticulophagy regulator 3-like isoform X2 [Panonychus citri]|uniref:reticulophagy regulator 3-like isoform X2 n=1 Tax=Panonychus citri TaxID=50023 RepID=UPI002307796E|nr:reticulophagy regulator 3-like isoform X2 [Panonychus citri]
MSNFFSRAVNSLSNKLDRISSKVVSTTSPSTQDKYDGSNKDDDHGNLPTSFSTKLLLLLAPFEEYFVSIQSILIWERPYVSAVFLIAINCLYWLIVSWTRRFFSIVSLVCLVTSIYQCWSFYVWPEIRARPPEPDEGWVPVHPTVLSAPELTHYINEIITISGAMVDWFWQLRKNQPGLFCSMVTVFLTITAIIGSLVPGVVILYIILMTVAIGPGVFLYVVPESWYQTVRNFFGNSMSSTPSSSLSPSNSKATLTCTPEIHDIEHLNISSSHEKEQGRKLSEAFTKCDQLEESFEMDKDESSLQLLSDSKLDGTLDFELADRPSRESSSPSSSNNSSLQLVPSMQFGETGAETGDELEDYEIISDSDLPNDTASNQIYSGLSKVLFQKSKGTTTTTTSDTTTSSVSSTSTTTPTKDMLESDL